MTRGPEQTQENHCDIKEGVDEGALLSEAVCKVLLVLNFHVVSYKRAEVIETGLCHGNKLPWCQDGAILWFAGGDGEDIMQLLGGKESTLNEADCRLVKYCIILFLIMLEAAE